MSRRSPRTPWSAGVAAFREPNVHSRREMKIALLYPDRASLLADYDRSARWREVRGAVAQTHSVSLEKTPEGEPWLDFGLRHYLAQPMIAADGGSKALERPEDRIAVPVGVGGINRMKVRRLVGRAEDLVLLFNVYNPGDPEDFGRQLGYLLSDRLGPMPGTLPITLSGLFTLGDTVLTAGCRARHAARRRSGRSS